MRTKEKENENGSETRTRSYAIAGTLAIAIALIAAMMVMPAAAQDEIVWEYNTGLAWPASANRLSSGNTLISDCGNSRIIEVDPAKNIVWSYSTGLLYPCDSDRLSSGNTLISDTYNDRIIEVDPAGNIVWSYNISGANPTNADRLSNGNTLIADKNNKRVIEVDPAGNIVWSFSLGSSCGLELNDGDRLSSGNTLICKKYGNPGRVFEVDPAGNIVWEYTGTALDWPLDADRLSNGNTLIADNKNNRVIEVDPAQNIIWEYSTGLNQPMGVDHTSDGNTVIADTFNNRVIEVGTPQEPDLVVEKSVEFNDDGKFVVSYTVTNIGDGPAGESTTCKYVNDQEMEREPCPALGSGESYSGTFEPEPCPCGAILNVTVCADNDNVVEECNETNNCEVNIVECPDPWREINEELDSLKGNVSAATMPSIIKHRLIDKLEYAKALKENAKIECEAGNFDGATKKLGVAKSQVESFASMVKITRRISPADKASFLADSAEIKGKIQALIEYIDTKHKC